MVRERERGCRFGERERGVGLVRERGVGLVREREGVGLVRERGVGLVRERGVGLVRERGVGLVTERGVGLVTERGVGLVTERGVGLVRERGVGLVTERGVGLVTERGVGLVRERGCSESCVSALVRPREEELQADTGCCQGRAVLHTGRTQCNVSQLHVLDLNFHCDDFSAVESDMHLIENALQHTIKADVYA